MKSLKSRFRVEYCALTNAIHRCHNPEHVAYKRYGARGITVCDEWRDPVTGLQSFLAHVGFRPDPTYSLDRIDNDKGYEPGNVRWADRKTQQNNIRRKATFVTDYGWGIGVAKPTGVGPGHHGNPSALLPFDGRIQTVADWARELSIPGATIRQRLERGLTPEQALSSERQTNKRVTQPGPISELPVPAPELDDPDVALVREVSKAINILTSAIEQFKGRLH